MIYSRGLDARLVVGGCAARLQVRFSPGLVQRISKLAADVTQLATVRVWRDFLTIRSRYRMYAL
jgi:hypothetical protein